MKKIISLFLAFAMCLLLAACGGNGGSDSDSAEKAEKTNEITDAIEETENVEADIISVNSGDTIKTDFMEMTLNNLQIDERLVCEINTRGDNIILGEVAEGKKVVYFTGEIKNIYTDSIGGSFSSNDCIWGNMCFDGKYNYDFKMFIQNGEDMKGTISPFSTGTYYLYAHIPNELLESYTECTLNFGFSENLESYDSSYGEGFSFDKCEYKYSLSLTK